MRYLGYLAIGMLFGVTLLKSGAASWFRIYEMFSFESFHMYGIIGSALVVGTVAVQVIERFGVRSFHGEEIVFNDKARSVPRYLVGGIIFGLGWALVGACPGPLFVLLGAGYLPILVLIGSALLGTFAYGLVRDRIPH